MSRYWSEQDGRYVDGEPVWDGRGALPGVGGIGWQQRESPLAKAPSRHDFVSVKESAAIRVQDDSSVWRRSHKCGCGRAMKAGKKRCAACARSGRQVKRTVAA